MKGVFHRWVRVVLLSLAAVACDASAGTLIDFESSFKMGWRVWAGGFSDTDNPQLSFSPSGMRLRLDSSKTRNGRRMAAPGPTAKPSICAPTRLRLVVSGPSRNGADISRISLGLVDAHGEKFEFRPADSIRSGESEWTLVYEILERGWVDGFKGMTPKKGFTSGTNRNDTLDFPLKLEILYVRLKDGSTKGDATFVHLADEADAHPAARLQCVASSGAGSARCAMLPGPKPALAQGTLLVQAP